MILGVAAKLLKKARPHVSGQFGIVFGPLNPVVFAQDKLAMERGIAVAPLAVELIDEEPARIVIFQRRPIVIGDEIIGERPAPGGPGAVKDGLFDNGKEIFALSAGLECVGGEFAAAACTEHERRG